MVRDWSGWTDGFGSELAKNLKQSTDWLTFKRVIRGLFAGSRVENSRA